MTTTEIDTPPAPVKKTKKTKKTKQAKRSTTNKATLVTAADSVPVEMAITSGSATTISNDQRQQMIETAAWLLAEKRGFCGGNSMDDWLCAETEVDAMICKDQQNNPLI